MHYVLTISKINKYKNKCFIKKVNWIFYTTVPSEPSPNINYLSINISV